MLSMQLGADGVIFFFFQAEDGIRDLYVTGVQTCALPIFHRARGAAPPGHAMNSTYGIVAVALVAFATLGIGAFGLRMSRTTSDFYVASRSEIGRASCRERV